MKALVLDIETDGLYDYKNKTAPTQIHVIGTKDVQTGSEKVFVPDHLFEQYPGDNRFKLSDFPEFTKGYDKFICHNLIKYDRRVLRDVINLEISIKNCYDSLVVSRILDPAKPKHGLEYYGELFGIKKPSHEDWSQLSEEMITRVLQDVRINLRLYNEQQQQLRLYDFSDHSVRIEHYVQYYLDVQEENGFYVNSQEAFEIYIYCKETADYLEKELQKAFPPKPKPFYTEISVPVTYTKKGVVAKNTKGSKFVPSLSVLVGEHCPFYYEVFNPGSPKQVVERLLELGWVPFDYTKMGAPQVTDESLDIEGLPDAVKLFGRYRKLRSRQKTVEQWLGLQDKDGYVHGSLISIKAWTHRASHTNPNIGNVPKVKKDKETKKPLLLEEGKFGYESRHAWQVEDKINRCLIGCDADQIQLRGLAHYLKSSDYVEQILEGDIHTYNQNLAELDNRDQAKTFIYSYVFGGGAHQLGTVLAPKEDEIERILSYLGSHPADLANAKKALTYKEIPENDHNIALAYKGLTTRQKFERNLVGLSELKETFRKGWFKALDGRQIWVEWPHKTLAAMLQSFERIVMVWGMHEYHKEATKVGIPFWQRNWVHDEYQTETLQKFNYLDTEGKTRNELGDIMEKSLTKAGEMLSTYCPISGGHSVGFTWADTH